MNRALFLMSGAAGALILATGAHAATATATDTAAAAATDSSGSTTVLDVVVTAEKREVSLQQVPVAVSAFSDKQRDLEGITTIQDLTNFTPGLTYSSQLDRAAIRGLARLSNTLSADSSVAVYNDELYSTSTFLVGLDDLFIDRVEIERGPQGTLYGRNAIGGLINTVSKRPTDDFSGELRASYGNFDRSNIEGTISGPLAPGLTARFSGYWTNQNEGYFTNVVPGAPSEGGVVHDWYWNTALEWKPTANDDAWLDFYDYGFDGDRGGPGSLLGTPITGHFDTALPNFDTNGLTFNPNFGFATPTGAIGAATGPVAGTVAGIPPGVTDNPALNNIRDFAHAIPTEIHLQNSHTLNFHWLHHFDGFDVKYVGGYSQYHYQLDSSLFNGDNSPITSFEIPINPHGTCAALEAIHACTNLTVFPEENFQYIENNHWTSHELTFSSTGNGPVQWIAGAYYYDQNYNDPITISQPQQPQLGPNATIETLAGTASPFAAQNNNWYTSNYNLQTQSEAIYGQVDWKVADTIKLTGGLRYTYDKKSGFEDYRVIAFSDLSPTLSAENLGSLLPAVDITPGVAISAATLTTKFKGVSCLPFLVTTGEFAGAFQRCLDDHSDAVTGTAGAEWTPNSDTLAYLRYNRGYKAFGFNAGSVTANPEAAPETVDDVEVGLKQSVGSALQYNVDAFYYNYMNDQVPIGVSTGGIIVTEFLSVPKSVSDGFEGQVVWSPLEHLALSLTYSYDHTEILSDCTVVGGQNQATCFLDALDPEALAPGAKPVGAHEAPPNGLFAFSQAQSVKGDELPQAPANKISFNALYTWVFDPGNFSLSGTFVWKDKSFASVFERSYYEAPSWDQVDLRAVWSGDHDHYEIVGFVKNVFNTLGYDAAAAGTFSLSEQTQLNSYDLTPPRTYGIEVHYKW